VGFDFSGFSRDTGQLAAEVRVSLPREWLPVPLDAKTLSPVAAHKFRLPSEVRVDGACEPEQQPGRPNWPRTMSVSPIATR
jgi:hypothetical protein